MLIRIVKAECRHLYYELLSVGKANVLFIIIFLGLYVFCLIEGKPYSEYTTLECTVIVNIASIYIYLRMILTGIGLPLNSYEAEKYRRGDIRINDIGSFSSCTVYTTRICLKFLFATSLNIVTLFMIMSALNLIVNIGNFFIIITCVLLGTFHMLSIGFVVNSIFQLLNLRREFVAVVEILLVVAYFKKSYLYFTPINMMMTQLEGTISNDIILSQYLPGEFVSYSLLWVITVLISCGLIALSNYANEFIFLRDTYKKDEK